jgi:OOP family OmpA-OmpF porin
MDKGVEEERLIAEGKGETMPIADNNRSAGRAENRRVEFHIIAPEPPPEPAAEEPAAEEPAPEAPAEEAAEE